jgi:uncharacterized tellurite resistance protein B-like protein
MDIWDKHRHRSNQTICIIGILILGTKLCQSDGDFTEVEREELLNVFPHDAKEREKMEKVIKEVEKDKNPIEYHAHRIKKYINSDNHVFLEFIVAVLYKLAHVDHVYSKEEDEEIRVVAKIFGIKKSWFERFFLYLKDNIFNFYNAKFRQNTL